MLQKFLVLDEFLAPRLVPLFYVAGLGLAALVGGVGMLVGLALAMQSALAGLVVVVLSLAAGAAVALGTRLLAEAVIAVFRMHQRFVGGGPHDPVPD